MKIQINHTSWKSIALAFTVSLLMSGNASAAPAQAPLTVILPTDTFSTSVPGTTVIIEPVLATFIDPSILLVGFRGEFTYDSSVVDFALPAAEVAGLTANGWQLSATVINSGPLMTKTLSISAFSNDSTPLNGSGTLFELRMLRASNNPGDLSSLAWKAPPDNFVFIDVFGGLHRPDPGIGPNTNQNDGLITITGTTPPPVGISGSAIYCFDLNAVPDVTLTLTGDMSGTTTSAGDGSYTFPGLPFGGSYTVTPAKAALLPGSPGISTVDVIATQRHFLNLTLIPVGCRRDAADVNGDNAINTVDVLAIQRFFIGRTTGIANVGKYQFSPASRSYSPLTSNQTGQNYDTVVFGDVAAGFVHRAEEGMGGRDE